MIVAPRQGSLNKRDAGLNKRRSVSPSACSTGSETTESSKDPSIELSVPDQPAASFPSKEAFSLSESGTTLRLLRNFACGGIGAAVSVAFSLWLPFTLAREAALKTYLPAFWNYDPSVSLFDNSPWTYGTDYMLAFCMLCLTLSMPKTDVFASAGRKASGLLYCYLFSVLAGGLAHQFYTTNDSRNSTSFRLLWIVCVGTVALASGFMGAVGGELVRLRNLKPLPDIPDSFWISYAVAIAGMVAAGCFSYQRPACDIFIVGITQFPSTVYITLALLQFDATRSTRRSVDGTMWWRLLGMAGFLLNAPLLPLYPILVQYTDWSLASVNTLLHAWLTVSWSMQGISMYHAGKCINKETRKQI